MSTGDLLKFITCFLILSKDEQMFFQYLGKYNNQMERNKYFTIGIYIYSNRIRLWEFFAILCLSTIRMQYNWVWSSRPVKTRGHWCAWMYFYFYQKSGLKLTWISFEYCMLSFILFFSFGITYIAILLFMYNVYKIYNWIHTSLLYNSC